MNKTWTVQIEVTVRVPVDVMATTAEDALVRARQRLDDAVLDCGVIGLHTVSAGAMSFLSSVVRVSQKEAP